MSAGLATSTVTPGRTAPEESRATPAMVAVWAAAIPGMRTHPRTKTTFTSRQDIFPPSRFFDLVILDLRFLVDCWFTIRDSRRFIHQSTIHNHQRFKDQESRIKNH